MYGSIGEWSKVRAEDVYRNLLDAKSKGYEKVKFRVNCPGGSIFEGIAAISAIHNSGLEVTAAIDGMAASMGAVIICAIDDVEMAEGARIMIHQGSSLAYGQSFQLRDQADLLDSLNRTLSEYIAKKTGKDQKWIMDNWMADGKDKWFTAKEALDAKLIKRIVPGKAKPLPKEEASFMEMAAHYQKFFNDTNETEMNKEQLIKELGLKADATEAEILAAVASLKKDNKETKPSNEKEEGKDNDKAKAAIAETIVALAKEKGETDEAKLATIKKVALIDAEAALTLLPKADAGKEKEKEKDKPLSVNELLAAMGKGGNAATSDRSTWDYKKWEKEDAKGLMALAKTKPSEFSKLFEASFGYAPSESEILKLV